MKKDKIVIWPANLDSERSRKGGRSVSKSLAVESPTAEEIFEASRSLGYDPILESGKKLSSCWWARSGRVLLQKRGRKSETLAAVASALRKSRAKRRD